MSRIAHLPSIELLPCPFCAGKAELLCNETEDPDTYVVQCVNFEDSEARSTVCNVYCCAGPYQTAAEAAQVWNTRKGQTR